MEKAPQDLSPSSAPFDAYLRTLPADTAAPLEPSLIALECIALAKRILLQERVREFTASDVVALAAIIESRDREFKLHFAIEK